MKPVSLIIRRTHLYLAFFCLPWFVMYAVTAIAFHHGDWFSGPDDLYNVAGPNWTRQQAWPCSIPVPAEGDVPQEVARGLLEVAGIDAPAFGAFRSGANQVSTYVTEFWDTRRLVYDIDRQRLTLYTRRPVAATTLRLMHSRAGYRHESLLDDLWAIMVDTVMVAILLWVATGLYMWWQQRKLRLVGSIVLLAGVASIAMLLVTL